MKWVVLLFTTTLFLSSCQSEPEESRIPEIDKKYLSESQLFALNQAVEREPGESENYYKRAIVYLERKDKSKAFADIEKAIKLDPQKGKYYLLKGRILKEMKNFEEALSVLRQAEALRVDDAELKILLADLFLQTSNKSKAFKYLEEASLLTPFHPEVLFLRGKLFAIEGDTVQALSNYFSVVHKDTGNVPAYKELARIYYNRKKLDSSMLFLTAGRVYEPNDPFFPYLEGRILNVLDFESSALANYHTALMLDSTYSASYNALGTFWYKKGDLDKAKKYFEKELKYDSTSVNSSLYLAEIYEKQDEGYLSIPLLERVLKQDSLNKVANVMLDRLYKKYPKPKVEVLPKRDTVIRKPVQPQPPIEVDTVKKVQPVNPVKVPKPDSTIRRPEPKPSAKPKMKDTTKKDNEIIPLIKNPDSTKIETPKEKAKPVKKDSLSENKNMNQN